MVVFACAGCGAVLTARVARVALPDHAGQKYGHDLLPGLLEPGTYAVDPGDGRPWRPWEPEPEERGGRLQMYRITGPPNRIGIAPGAVDSLLPPGPPERHLVLAGPGLPDVITDIALVPRHPQTGAAWPCEAGVVVPLAADVWTYMAFEGDRGLVPAAVGMPADARRDDPPPLLPRSLFGPDGRVFLSTLERMAAVRPPWLRRIHDRVKDHSYADPFS